MGEQSIWKTAVQHVLQELHRKSLGHELQGDFRRLGSATDQRPFVRQRNQERACPAALQRRPEQSHQDADQFFPLSATRSGNDVGGVRRKDDSDGWQIGDELQSDALFLRRFVRPMECRIQKRRRRSANNRSRTCDFVGADAGAGPRFVAGRE